MSTKKALVFLATGFEEIEAIGIIDILRRGGAETLTVSITGDKTVVGAHKIPIVADAVFENVDFDSYDAIILPGGGPGSEMLNAHEDVRQLIIDYRRAKKYLAAICAAPRVFGSLGLLVGKNATCYPGIEKELIGANIVDANVVTCEGDGMITTGRGPGAVFEFALEVLRCLKEGSQKVIVNEIKELAEAMIAHTTIIERYERLPTTK